MTMHLVAPVTSGSRTPPPGFDYSIGTSSTTLQTVSTAIGWTTLFPRAESVISVKVSPTSNFEVVLWTEIRITRADGTYAMQYGQQTLVATSGKTQYLQIPISLSYWISTNSTYETITASVHMSYSTVSGTPNNIEARAFLDLLPFKT